MASIAQRHTRLSGVDYAPGDVVPDGAVSRSVRNLGLVSTVPDSAAAGVLIGEDEAVAAFDPGAHTVAEVVLFLARYPDATERVRAQEEAGSNRSTLLAVIDDESADDEPDEAVEPALPPAESPEPATDGAAVPPPRTGPGSSREAWAAFASSSGVGYEDGASKADIIATLEAAGHLDAGPLGLP